MDAYLPVGLSVKFRFKSLLLAVVLAVVAGALVVPSTAGAFAGGDGSVNNPHQLEDCDDLREMDDQEVYSGHYFVLIADIDCNNTPFDPLGYELSGFTGDLDGDGYEISNLNIEENHGNVGMFFTINGARIHDIGFVGASVEGGQSRVGTIAGTAELTQFINVHVIESSVTGTSDGDSHLGGFVGFSFGSEYENIWSDVDVSGEYYINVGGVAGYSYNDQIDGAYVDEVEISANNSVGGLLGFTKSPGINDAESDASVYGTVGVGGLVGVIEVDGEHEGGITNSVTNGSVEGDSRVGGFIGNIDEVSDSLEYPYEISLSQSNADASGYYSVGGFVGLNTAGSIYWSVSTGDVTGILCECDSLGGFVGSNNDDDNLSGDIWESYATGNIYGDASWNSGGFVGNHLGGTITDAYARGVVEGYDTAGGFAGNVDQGIIDNTYSTGEATGGSDVGGHAGLGSSATISDSFWDEEASGVSSTAGGSVGLTTTEAKTQSTYTAEGWDFTDVWGITPATNEGYPCLKFGEAACPSDSDEEVLDEDEDGISDEIENGAPNDGDGNEDGIPDSQQNNVASFVSPITSQYVTLAVSDDCSLSSVSLSASSEKAVQDIAFKYPVGLVNFTATCEGDEAAVEIRFFNLEDAGFVTRKYNPNTQVYFTIEGATLAQEELAGLKFVKLNYAIADNGPLDFNSDEGIISDPVGLGQAVVGAPRTGGGGTAE